MDRKAKGTHQLIRPLEVHDILLINTLGEELVVDLELFGPLRGPHFVLDRLEGQCWPLRLDWLRFPFHLLLLLLLHQWGACSRRSPRDSVVVVKVATSLPLPFLRVAPAVNRQGWSWGWTSIAVVHYMWGGGNHMLHLQGYTCTSMVGTYLGRLTLGQKFQSTHLDRSTNNFNGS